MTGSPATGDPAAFVGKWRAAWPEWSLAEIFIPHSQRAVAEAWQALQFEWQEAAWRNDDARPGEAKLRWWMEELDGWARGMRRHPLGAVLQRIGAPWRALALALPSLDHARERPRDRDHAWQQLRPLTAALAEAEASAFSCAANAPASAACWLHARLARHAMQAVPQQFVDSEADGGAVAWSRDLLAQWPTQPAPRSTAIMLSLAEARLARRAPAAPLPPWSALWRSWRAARR